MRYFRLIQDERITDAPIALDYHQSNKTKSNPYNIALPEKQTGSLSLKISRNPNIVCPDILCSPTFAVSAEVKEVLAMYNDDWEYKNTMFYEPELEQTYMYYRPTLLAIDCLTDKCIYTNARKTNLSQVFINLKSVNNNPLFLIPHLHNSIIIIRLDLAESLLVRNYRGFSLQPVATER